MMKSNQSSCLVTRLSCLPGLRAVCCCILLAASSASAQLSQQDIEDAFYNALMQWGTDTSGYAGIPVMVPTDWNFNYDLDYYLSSYTSQMPVGQSAWLVMRYLSGANPYFYDFLRSLSPSQDLTRVIASLSAATNQLRNINLNISAARTNELSSLVEDVDSISFRVGGMTYTGASELYVHDDELFAVNSTLANTYDYLQYLFLMLEGSFAELGDIIVEQNTDYWDQYPGNEVSNAMQEASAEMTSEEQTAGADFREIDLPEVYDDYTPVPSFGDNPPDDLGLDNVENPVSHNALLRLVRAPRGSGSGNRSINLPVNSSGLPDIEVDFGNMGSLVSGMGSFATWIEWLSGVLFGLLLTVKGLTMYRICRSATTYASVGENPTVHLAWNPF